MKFELIKQKSETHSYKSNGEMVICERMGHIFYVEGLPAFIILENGEIDPITPDGMCIYSNNKEECDIWLKTKMAP